MTSKAPTGWNDPPGGSLDQQIRALILRDGPITFARFMEVALYHPGQGFYERFSIGDRGHFVTSPHVSALFGTLLGHQVEEFWTLLGRPEPFDVVEAGAGDGTLAEQILGVLSEGCLAALRYTAAETSRRARDSISARLPDISTVGSIQDLGPGLTGCLVANELLDNLPFHILRGTVAGEAELLVGVEQGKPGRFGLVEGPPAPPELASLAPNLQPGQEAVVSPAAHRFIEDAARLLDRGYVLIIDYGFVGGERPPGPHSYRDQRLTEEVLADPGSRDITAGVDFDSLARHANSLGLSVWGPVSQREALLGLGFRERVDRALSRQSEASSEGRAQESARIYSERNRAGLLIDPRGLGDFKVLCVGVGTGTTPSSVRGWKPGT